MAIYKHWKSEWYQGKVDYDVMYVDKKATKAGNPGLNAEASNDMLKYTGSPVTINVNLTVMENH